METFDCWEGTICSCFQVRREPGRNHLDARDRRHWRQVAHCARLTHSGALVATPPLLLRRDPSLLILDPIIKLSVFTHCTLLATSPLWDHALLIWIHSWDQMIKLSQKSQLVVFPSNTHCTLIVTTSPLWQPRYLPHLDPVTSENLSNTEYFHTFWYFDKTPDQASLLLQVWRVRTSHYSCYQPKYSF